MNSTPSPKAIEPDDALVARADERLARVYAQLTSADEEIARVNEHISKLDDGAAHHPSAVLGRRPARRRSMLRGLIGLLLAACIFGAAFVSQSSYGDAAKQIIAGWAPQLLLTSSPPPENPGLAAQTSPSPVQLAGAEPVAAEPAAAQSTASSPTAPQDVAPAAAPIPPELAQLLQTMARDLANLEQGIEQLKASQEQMARENANAVEQLRAGQEQMTRLMAKPSEQKAAEPNPRPRTSTPPPPRPVAAPARKPSTTPPSTQARASPRAPTQLQPQAR